MFYVWKFIVGHRFDTHPPFQAEILLFFPLFLLSYYNPAPLWDLPLLSPSPLLSFSFSSSCFFFSLLSSLFFKIFFAVALWVKGLWLNGPQRGPWTSHLLRERFLDFTQALNHSSALPLETSLAHSGSLPTVPPFLLFVCHPAVDPDECSLLCPAKNECKKWTCVHCGQSVGVWGFSPFLRMEEEARAQHN